jgi:hypothetical protein
VDRSKIYFVLKSLNGGDVQNGGGTRAPRMTVDLPDRYRHARGARLPWQALAGLLRRLVSRNRGRRVTVAPLGANWLRAHTREADKHGADS